MQIMNNGARSAEVVNYQGSGAAKLRRDLAYKVARVAMRIQSDVLASSNKKNEKRGNKNDTL